VSNRKKYTLKWAEAASRDLKRLHAFIKKENPHAALLALQRIVESSENLRLFSEMGRRSEQPNNRELSASYGSGAYVLRYRADKTGHIIILRVWHSREQKH
jgi:plasmid stabilization system protein ParE